MHPSFIVCLLVQARFCAFEIQLLDSADECGIAFVVFVLLKGLIRYLALGDLGLMSAGDHHVSLQPLSLPRSPIS
jgi:hypothetical protein